MKTKKDKSYSYEHTKQRALERYGIELTPKMYEEWANRATAANCIQVDKSNIQTVHNIEWNGTLVTIVYKHTEKNGSYIATVLPEGTKLMFGTDTPQAKNLSSVSNWYKKRVG